MTDLKLLVLDYAASEALRPYEKAAHEAATDGDEVSTVKLSALTVGPGETRR
jgi:hypothetical protein